MLINVSIDNSTFACMSRSYIFNQKLTVNIAGRRALEILITLGVLLRYEGFSLRFLCLDSIDKFTEITQYQ